MSAKCFASEHGSKFASPPRFDVSRIRYVPIQQSILYKILNLKY